MRTVNGDIGDACHRCGKGDCRDDRAGVGLEEVGSHSRHIPDVIAHVVCNNGWVARIVFRQAGLHLSNQVGSDIRCFCVNTSADSREERD